MTENTVEIVNAVRVCGTITQKPYFSHEILGEKFYVMVVEVERLSGNIDYIPVEVSDRLVDIDSLVDGMGVQVYGSFRSFNKKNADGRNSLILNVFANEITEVPEGDERGVNEIIMEGYVCKEAKHRVTPLGREICDMLLAVNRAYGKSDYIPCIAWGRNAAYVGNLDVGAHLRCEGRIQSRIYLKDGEERTAYEVSLTSIRKLD